MITTEEITQLENEAEQRGTSKLVLMERAGRGVVEYMQEYFDLNNKKVLIVAYHGNNGGDGFVAAKYLKDICEVRVLFIGDEEKLKDEAKVNYDQIINDNKIEIIQETLFENLDDSLRNTFNVDFILDCILGTGARGSIGEPIATIIDWINNSHAYKISIDIPTGIDADTGEKSNKFIKADLVLTMHDIKQGLSEIEDIVRVIDIGL